MANIVDFRLGGSWDEANERITDERFTFTIGETVHAWHKWENIGGSNEMIIRFEKKINGVYEFQFLHSYSPVPSWTWAWHHAYITNVIIDGGAGEWLVKFSYAGQSGASIPFIVEEPAPPPEVTTNIHFISNPSSAIVKVDGVPLGITPLNVEKERDSRHTINLSKEGYIDANKSLQWPSSGSQEHHFFLDPIPLPNTTINFTSDPTGAQVVVGVSILGPTPVSAEREANSTHSVGVTHSDFPGVERSITWPSSGSRTEHFDFVVEPSWWQRLIQVITGSVFSQFLTTPAPFRLGFIAAFGREPTDEEITNLNNQITDFIIPLNTVTKLLTGKNLKGETEDTTRSELALAGLDILLTFIPVGIIGRVANKVGIKFGGKAVLDIAGRAGLRQASPEVIEAMLKSETNFGHVFEAWRKAPGEWTKLAPKLSVETQALVSTALKNQHPRAASILFEESVVNAARSKVPITQATWNYLNANKGRSIFLAIAGAWGLMGFEAFTNWPLVDNIGFLQYSEALAVKTAFENNEITKEEALAEMDKIIELLSDINIKVKISANWNPLMMAFGDGFVITAQENLDTAQRIKDEIEGIAVENIGTLIIDAEPADAKITVGAEFPATGHFEKDLPAGGYPVVVSRFDYIPESYIATVVANETTSIITALNPEPEEPPPEENMVSLTINSTPTNAKIYVDNAFQFETTDTTILVTPEPHVITLKLDGYEDDSFEVDLLAGASETFNRILIAVEAPPTMATLTINSNPTDAKIYVDNVYTFEDTNTTIQITPGPHMLTLKKTGFSDISEPINLNAGDTKSFTFLLTELPIEPPAARPRVLITSEPSDADIYINGIFQFTTTPFTTFLDPGTYVFRIQKDGFVPSEIELVLEEGDNIIIPFELSTEPGAPPPIPRIIPPGEIPPYNYDLLFPRAIPFVPQPQITPSTQKELLINIETTDLLPWKGQIFSIAMLELNNLEAQTIVITDTNEKNLIEQFITFFDTGKYERIVGYNLAFDYRYLFSKIWLYRMQSKSFLDTELRDVMQIMKQVKEKFVFGFQKTGTLDDWGKYLFGMGKLGSQETLLREYIAGNFEYVEAFQKRQIELTANLYALARFSFAEGMIQPVVPASGAPPITSPNPPASSHEPQQTKQCKNCLQVNPFDASECFVCNKKF